MNGEPEANAAEKPAGPESELLAGLGELAMQLEAALDAEILGSPRAPYNRSATNYASEIGHPCKKNLVHCRLDWDKKRPMDARAMWRMKEGIEFERRIRAQLSTIGFELVENQASFTVPSHKIRGKIDGLAPIPGRIKLPEIFKGLRSIPAEIKFISPQIWPDLKTVEDIRTCRGWWIRKYASQLNIYMVPRQHPAGLFILGTASQRPRIIPMAFDPILAEHDLLKIEDVNKHVEAGTYPEPIPFEAQVCEMCDFNHLCTPLRSSWATVEITPADSIALEAYLEAKKRYDEVNKIYEAYKKELIGNGKKPGRYLGQNALYADIEISSKTIHRKGYSVDETDYVQTTIERIGE